MHQIVVRTVQRFALLTGASIGAARRQQARRILMFHGVGGSEMPVRDFEQLLIWLKRNLRVISLETMLESVLEKRPPDPRGELALTFDDGLRNQFELAYPLLQRLELSATMFVCPRLVDRQEWLWNHEVRARWRRLDADARTCLSRELGADGSSEGSLIDWMKSIRIDERDHARELIRRATPEFHASASEHAAYDMMRWEDMTSMDARLVTIGSHTLSHPILPQLDDEGLESELRDSRVELEQRLQRPVPLFCYPNGSTDSRVSACASRHYRAAVSTEEALLRDIPDPWNIPRIPASRDLALSAWRLHRPQA